MCKSEAIYSASTHYIKNMKQSTIIALTLLLLISEAFAVASPSFRSIETDLTNSKQTRFEKQIKKQ